MKAALFWEPVDDSTVDCRLCPHHCRIADGKSGLCLARRCLKGRLYAFSYGEYSSLHLDPIEKKPLYHFKPGRKILSIGNNGCNLACDFCQNWQISQERAPVETIDPERLARLGGQHGSIGVAFTYAEPMIWYEFVSDSARLLRRAGLATVLVTNGTVEPEPLEELLPLVDAMNIDLKAIRPEFYTRTCRGFLETVLETIRRAAPRCHLELTNLLIPGVNDDPAEIRQLVEFVASVDRGIPLHFSRYFPSHRMTLPPTDLARLEEARRIGLETLDFVYLGNAPGASDTVCPECGELLVKRSAYDVTELHLTGPGCPRCGHQLRLVV